MYTQVRIAFIFPGTDSARRRVASSVVIEVDGKHDG